MSGFDWQAEGHRTAKKWILPLLMAQPEDGRVTEKFAALAEATKDFTDVTITIQVNGIEVPVDHFLECLEDNIEHAAREDAREILDELPGFNALRSKLAQIEQAVNAQVDRMVEEAGLQLPPRSEEW